MDSFVASSAMHYNCSLKYMIPLHPIFPDIKNGAEIHPLIIIQSNIPTYLLTSPLNATYTTQARALERAHCPTQPAVTKYSCTRWPAAQTKTTSGLPGLQH